MTRTELPGSTYGGPSRSAPASPASPASIELATTGAHWLTGLPLVGPQILVVLLARSSSDKTRLIPPT